MRAKDAISLIEKDIKWHKENRVARVTDDFRDGFITGMEQAKYLIVRLLETSLRERFYGRDEMEGLTEGRIVHYVAYNGRHLASMVIGVNDKEFGNVDLVVFTNMENVNGLKNFGVQFHQGVVFSPEQSVGKWHWIEKA